MSCCLSGEAYFTLQNRETSQNQNIHLQILRFHLCSRNRRSTGRIYIHLETQDTAHLLHSLPCIRGYRTNPGSLTKPGLLDTSLTKTIPSWSPQPFQGAYSHLIHALDGELERHHDANLALLEGNLDATRLMPITDLQQVQ